MAESLKDWSCGRLPAIGDEGAKHLAASLKVSHLKILDLGGNHIGDQGAKAFTDALPKLCLSNNSISDLGAEHLAAGLKANQLSVLELGGDMTTDQLVRLVAENLEHFFVLHPPL